MRVVRYVILSCVSVTGLSLLAQQDMPLSTTVVVPKTESAVITGTQTQPAVDAPTVQMTITAPSPVQAPAPVVTTSTIPAPQVNTSQQEEQLEGITTVNLEEPQGNWLFKRMWWQRAQVQYEKIKALVDMIMESRMIFFAKRTEWDKTIFDPFYIEIGVGRGVLEELVANLVTQLDQERAQGHMDQAERDLLTALQAEKETLEQLQKDIQKINDIDAAVDKAIAALIEQINVARGYEKQSWQNFKQIAQELSDKKARELYYTMQTHWQNINQIADYIQHPFLQYFDQLGKLAQETTAKVSASMKALKEKGVDFKRQWQVLEEKNRQDLLKKEHQEGFEEGKKAEESEHKEQPGLFSRIASGIGNQISLIWGFITSSAQSVWNFTFGRFFGAKTQEPESLPAMPQTAPPVAEPTAMSEKISASVARAK